MNDFINNLLRNSFCLCFINKTVYVSGYIILMSFTAWRCVCEEKCQFWWESHEKETIISKRTGHACEYISIALTEWKSRNLLGLKKINKKKMQEEEFKRLCCYLGMFLGITQSRVNDFHAVLLLAIYRIHLICFYMSVSIILSYLMVYSKF